jgi:hypothetical protein
LPWANDLLISAGGDDFIALWDYVPGKLLQTLNVKEIIETKVKYIILKFRFFGDNTYHPLLCLEKL